ncbi:transmembrane protein 26b [Trichomycterus rosablanca]|uniref:transmembrane protein 26b n=1 Tax=Trichomycterus rosablanca TaxID=2290929 RepID=UPI002F35D7B4
MLQFICAVVTRLLFILLSLIGVWRVIIVKNDKLYGCLLLLFIPLVIEMIITLKRRKGGSCKWFSPAIFLFLISIIPSIWILELDQHNQRNHTKCEKLIDILTNTSSLNDLSKDSKIFLTVCANDWILALHQVLLILLIVGKWLMPMEGLTRDQLSQLLLIFVGTAADILEFTSETLSDVKDKNFVLVYIILGVWTWSMLQFPYHLSVLTVNEEGENQGRFSLSRHSADIWTTVEALLIHDGPFLLVRLIIMTHFGIIHQMLVFFAIKNFLVVLLNAYRLCVVCWASRSVSSDGVSGPPSERVNCI